MSRLTVHAEENVVLFEAGPLGDRVFAIFSDVLHAQSESVAGKLRLAALLGRCVLEQQSARSHAPQVPGCRAPRNVAVPPPPVGHNFQRDVDLFSSAHDLRRDVCRCAGVVQHPLNVGDRKDWLAIQRHQFIACPYTRFLRSRCGLDLLHLRLGFGID